MACPHVVVFDLAGLPEPLGARLGRLPARNRRASALADRFSVVIRAKLPAEKLWRTKTATVKGVQAAEQD